MSKLRQTLTDLIQTRNSITGYDLSKTVSDTLNDSANQDAENLRIAQELNSKYFSRDDDEGERNYKPLKFVYYKVFVNREGEVLLRRNFYLSPRANGYFETERDTNDELRDIIRLKKPVLGSDLKRIVAELKDEDFLFPDRDYLDEEIERVCYSNLSIQLARYISQFFIECEKPIKDDVWYGVTCKEYATATVYRDLTKSPRQQSKDNKHK